MYLFRLYIFILSLAAGACTDGSVQNDPRPNIVLFLADDIGAECFGCMGGVSYDTHTIDSLARNGLFFPNMHAQPLSSPSRVQLMTGQYNDRNYVCFGYMNDDEPNFAQLARQAGYTTGMFGKWQLGRDRGMPTRLGWDEWCLFQLDVYKEFNGPTGTDRYANCMMDNHGHYEYSTYGPDGFEGAAFEFLRKALPALLLHAARAYAPYADSRFRKLGYGFPWAVREGHLQFPRHGGLSGQESRTHGAAAQRERAVGQYDLHLHVG